MARLNPRTSQLHSAEINSPPSPVWYCPRLQRERLSFPLIPRYQLCVAVNWAEAALAFTGPNHSSLPLLSPPLLLYYRSSSKLPRTSTTPVPTWRNWLHSRRCRFPISVEPDSPPNKASDRTPMRMCPNIHCRNTHARTREL